MMRSEHENPTRPLDPPCSDVAQWLLEADDPAAAYGPDVGAHLAACPECGQLRKRLARLEAVWRTIPLPAESDQARQRLLAHLEGEAARLAVAASSNIPAASGTNSGSVSAGRHGLKTAGRWVSAALLIFAVFVTVLHLSDRRHVEAAPDLVDRMIDWNLEIAHSAATDREDVFARRADVFRRTLTASRLSAADRDLAKSLLETGRWLTNQTDPLAEAERFSELTERLWERIRRAAEEGRADDLERHVRKYARVVRRGITGKIDWTEVANDRRIRRYYKLLELEARRQEAVGLLLHDVPGPASEQVRRTLEEEAVALQAAIARLRSQLDQSEDFPP